MNTWFRSDLVGHPFAPLFHLVFTRNQEYSFYPHFLLASHPTLKAFSSSRHHHHLINFLSKLSVYFPSLPT